MAEFTYRYVGGSTLTPDRGLGLATNGGRTAHPHFFRGFVEQAPQTARALLAVAEVARTRYFDASVAHRMRDPIVTSNVEVLRFEAFSSCNGVHVRFDLDAVGFDAEHVDWGCTNVDVNESLRTALTRISGGDPLRLSIGTERLTVETLDDQVVEHRVPLPERWLRGLGSVQVATAEMRPVAELGAAGARATLRDLPRQSTGNRPLHIAFGPRGARLTSRPGTDRATIVGPQRLTALRRLLPHVRGLSVLAPPPRPRRRAGTGDDALALQASAWVVHLDGARCTLVLSPELYRGFSGEGRALTALVAAQAAVVDAVTDRLAGQARLDAGQVAALTGSDTQAAQDALFALAARGRIGHDAAAGAAFHRDLPYPDGLLRPDRPRLDAAVELVEAGAVRLGQAASTVATEALHTVTHADAGDTCTCRWFTRHRGERGPCKHVLAVLLARTRSEPDR